MDAALERIAEKVRRAREAAAQPFGLSGHGMVIHPPLTEDEVAAIEARSGVALPEEYRGFVTRVGDGGAGPGFGLFRLSGALREARADVHPELLATPFPHTNAWNPLQDPEVIAFWRRADAGEVSQEDEELQWEREAAGTLPLCDEGGGYLHLLVVAGPARGTVWIDSRGADAGFIPLNATFLHWYERWIDDVLRGGRGTWWFGAQPVDAARPAGTPG